MNLSSYFYKYNSDQVEFVIENCHFLDDWICSNCQCLSKEDNEYLLTYDDISRLSNAIINFQIVLCNSFDKLFLSEFDSLDEYIDTRSEIHEEIDKIIGNQSKDFINGFYINLLSDIDKNLADILVKNWNNKIYYIYKAKHEKESIHN